MLCIKWDFEIAIETNGTQTASPGIDWICVSPKAQAELKLRSGHELKLVFPQDGAGPGIIRAPRFSAFFSSANGRCRT